MRACFLCERSAVIILFGFNYHSQCLAVSEAFLWRLFSFYILWITATTFFHNEHCDDPHHYHRSLDFSIPPNFPNHYALHRQAFAEPTTSAERSTLSVMKAVSYKVHSWIYFTFFIDSRKRLVAWALLATWRKHGPTIFSDIFVIYAALYCSCRRTFDPLVSFSWYCSAITSPYFLSTKKRFHTGKFCGNFFLFRFAAFLAAANFRRRLRLIFPRRCWRRRQQFLLQLNWQLHRQLCFNLASFPHARFFIECSGFQWKENWA